MSFVDFWFYPAAVCLVLFIALVQFVFRKREKLSNMISKIVLLCFSYVVMGFYDWRFCCCITAVIAISYVMPLMIERSEGKSKKILTSISVIALILFLGLFKYLNFFMFSVYFVFGRTWNDLNIILPLGISFYIFSAISYVLDVSWGAMEADRSLLNVALFLCFFPKQICGPIVKGKEFLPQLKENRRITLKNLETGVQIIVFGLFKKIVLADHLGVFVDDVYFAPSAYNTLTVWLAVFSSMLQLYFDFSGYSDMAIGMAKIFGYDIQRNFNLPFIAKNISEFWDRWHISLSSWLNEYLFNPIAMSMNRKVAKLPKEKRKKIKMLPMYVALIITFLVSGLWHGAGYTFIVWGMCHGIWSVSHSLYSNLMRQHYRGFADNKNKALKVLDILLTFTTVNLIQIFFRADSLRQAFYVIRRMFTSNLGIFQPYTWTMFAYIVLAIATVICYCRYISNKSEEVEGFYPLQNLNTVKGLTVFFVFCGLIVCLGYFGETYFIYGKF